MGDSIAVVMSLFVSLIVWARPVLATFRSETELESVRHLLRGTTGADALRPSQLPSLQRPRRLGILLDGSQLRIPIRELAASAASIWSC